MPWDSTRISNLALLTTSVFTAIAASGSGALTASGFNRFITTAKNRAADTTPMAINLSFTRFFLYSSYSKIIIVWSVFFDLSLAQ